MADWQFEIFVDDGCSLCKRESGWMRSLDAARGRLRITDIHSADFLNSQSEHGLTPDQAMRSIHGRFPDGQIVHGPAAFRAAYAAVDRGWLWAPTGWPIIRPLVDVAYRIFARWRYRRRMRTGCPLPGPAATQQQS